MALCPTGQSTTIEWQYPGEIKQRIIGADDYSITPVYSTGTIYSWKYHMGSAIFAATSFTPPNNGLSCDSPNRSPVRRCSDATVRDGDIGTYHVGYYAPIYSYRVSEHVVSPVRCIPNGSQPLSIPCGIAEGYRTVEILCHGVNGSAYNPDPVWVKAWWGKKNQLDTYLGNLLQVPNGGDYPVIYNKSLNRYTGFIPSNYNWGYFYFESLTNVFPTGYLFKVLKSGSAVYQRTNINAPTVTYFCGDSCPPGTCECSCGNRVCCHDPVTGAVIKSFIK